MGLYRNGDHRKRKEPTTEKKIGMTKQISMGLATPMTAGEGFVAPGALRAQAAPITPSFRAPQGPIPMAEKINKRKSEVVDERGGQKFE